MTTKLTGKVALVTGGWCGIGAAGVDWLLVVLLAGMFLGWCWYWAS